uniref:Solute carrier family 45 member 4 n=1 Tax=Sinocyclocheilus rhinocerous TaxID=307959 RepID=A0A673LLL9_9TELE
MQAAVVTPVEKRDGGGGANGAGGAGGRDLESQEESVSEGSIDRIPLRQWIMHGAVMFGREFCYAMETALVTPVLLQIGLPEQYYSLTWFLSPILGLIFTPLIGSASDRCTLRWGRRRPFILALCVGVLLGVALFLNGSLIGDNIQKYIVWPIGIVMTVLGVVVLDFSADATEGPIRAYLLDVADTEEQDMALNIHAFSAGLGGAVGYALGGLDWTHTFLGRTFKSQEQILFLFAAVLFTVSVALHLFSIEEQHVKITPHQPQLEMIHEDESYEHYDLYEGEAETTVRLLWMSMLKMPKELFRLCVCHLVTWFSIIAEAVFYTDFMGQVIYEGDPTAPLNSTALHNYHRGVQMGCWGLVNYMFNRLICSSVILHVYVSVNVALLQKYLDNFDLSIKVIYILGTLGFTVGTAVMAIFPNVYVSMVMISSMGIISMSISYCPYALLGQYHDNKEVRGSSAPGNSKRGFGIDCAILSCQVYISQILVASALGAVVDAVGSVRVIPMVASGGSFLGFLAACFLVIYPGSSGEADGAKAEQTRALTSPNNNSVTEKPSFLKLTRKGAATTTCKVECESTL